MHKKVLLFFLVAVMICTGIPSALAINLMNSFADAVTDMTTQAATVSSGILNADVLSAVTAFAKSAIKLYGYKSTVARADTPQDWYDLVMAPNFQNDASDLVKTYNKLTKYADVLKIESIISRYADNISMQDAIEALLSRVSQLQNASSTQYLGIVTDGGFLKDIVNFVDSYNRLPDSIDWSMGDGGGDPENDYAIKGVSPSIEMNPSASGTTFWARNMIDGKDSTCWQYRNPDGSAAATVDFIFSAKCSVASLWMKNGFWKITDGNDQYTRNSRPKIIELSFKYAGGSQYQNPIRITLKDDTARKDWQKHSFSTQNNVIAVRMKILSLYTGTKYPKDVAISEIAFYGP